MAVHTCHDMNPPFPGPCTACAEDRMNYVCPTCKQSLVIERPKGQRQDHLLENLRGMCACKPGERCTICMAADRLQQVATTRDQLLSLVEMWQEVDRSEAPTTRRYIALTDRRDTWLARHRAESGRCDGRYPVPATSPPRDEPFDVTYRCSLPKGHDGPHRSEP